MPNLPTRNQAQAYLNHLRDIRGDLCIESCVHSVATNTAEHCLEAYVSGRLIDGQAITDAWNVWIAAGRPRRGHHTWIKFAKLQDANIEENNDG